MAGLIQSCSMSTWVVVRFDRSPLAPSGPRQHNTAAVLAVGGQVEVVEVVVVVEMVAVVDLRHYSTMLVRQDLIHDDR